MTRVEDHTVTAGSRTSIFVHPQDINGQWKADVRVPDKSDVACYFDWRIVAPSQTMLLETIRMVIKNVV